MSTDGEMPERYRPDDAGTSRIGASRTDASYSARVVQPALRHLGVSPGEYISFLPRSPTALTAVPGRHTEAIASYVVYDADDHDTAKKLESTIGTAVVEYLNAEAGDEVRYTYPEGRPPGRLVVEVVRNE